MRPRVSRCQYTCTRSVEILGMGDDHIRFWQADTLSWLLIVYGHQNDDVTRWETHWMIYSICTLLRFHVTKHDTPSFLLVISWLSSHCPIVIGQFLVKRSVVTPRLLLNSCNYIATQTDVWLSSIHSTDWTVSAWSLFFASLYLRMQCRY